MSPSYLEVAVLVVGIAVAPNAGLGDTVANVKIALVFVAAIVVRLGLCRPAEVGIDLAGEGQVKEIVEGEVVAAILEVVATSRHPTV